MIDKDEYHVFEKYAILNYESFAHKCLKMWYSYVPDDYYLFFSGLSDEKKGEFIDFINDIILKENER